MLKPVRNWNALRHALDDWRREIYLCDACGYPWIGPAAKKPLRCANIECRVGADSSKHAKPGRPPLETVES